MNRSIWIALWCLVSILPVADSARAEFGDGQIRVDRPGPREFVLDKANLLDPAAKAKIQRECDKLLTDHATPIIVVTIPSIADVGGGSLQIETVARLLFDQWQIGIAKVGQEQKDWNTGILLLVSSGDRKARIELGAGWRRDNDQVSSQIMDERIIPYFKQGNYAAGIVSGVQALDDMARGKPLPTVPRPWWHFPVAAGALGLFAFTIISLVRHGANGWAWLFWGLVFSFVGYALYSMLTSSSSGGGFSGGSFGGGFSGGGGATGSW